MNIIRRGTPPKEKIYRGECPHCKSVFEAERTELDIRWGGQRDEYEYGVAPCEVCGYAGVAFYEVKER
jgi:C4-type Zn-finger protein